MELLVHKAKMHDKDAFSQLFRMHTSGLYVVAKAILKNDDDAADAIQETALVCWQNIHSLKKEKYFKTWLTRILINNCNKIYKQKSRLIPTVDMQENSTTDDSYTAVEWREFLNCLDEKYRTVAILYYVEGFKIREIADILDLNENTVSGRLATARDKMEKQYTRSSSTAFYKVCHPHPKRKEILL